MARKDRSVIREAPGQQTSSRRRAGSQRDRRKASLGHSPQPAGSPRVVAVTGAFGSLGRRVVRLLEADPEIDKVVALDVRSALGRDGRDAGALDPRAFLDAHPRLRAHAIDLTVAGANSELGGVLARERVGAVIHLAFLSSPTHALEMAHELETIGTLYVLQACRAARVEQLVCLSSTMCYGARPDNPAWLTEDHPLRPPPSRSLRDKAEADAQVRRFADEQPHVAVSVARVGAMLGSAPDHFWTRMFARPVVPVVLGYDPLMQLMLADDAADGIVALWRARARGTFNVVGRGVLPLSHVVTRLRRVPLFLPSGVGQAVLGALWSAQLVDIPARFLDFFRWPWVCDGTRLRAATGYAAPHDITTALSIFASTRPGRGADAAAPQGPDARAEAAAAHPAAHPAAQPANEQPPQEVP